MFHYYFLSTYISIPLPGIPVEFYELLQSNLFGNFFFRLEMTGEFYFVVTMFHLDPRWNWSKFKDNSLQN